MRCYLAGPYASHITGKDDAVWAATRSLVALRGFLRPVLHVDEVIMRDKCIWSPLIHGHFILYDKQEQWDEALALNWCLYCLEFKGFDTLVISTTPRKPGYGRNGVDAERQLAERLGYRIMSEVDAANLE